MPDRFAVPIICGPTGCGKTAVAVALAEQFAVEVISADSRQIIKHLDIGTAKPTRAECNKVRFHLVDLIEPGERFSAYRFVEAANAALEQVTARGKWPLVVGGAGLYLKALTDGVVKIDNENSSIRNRLVSEMEQLGVETMFQRLTELDPDEAARLHPNNKVRVIRALEMCELTGRSKTELLAEAAHLKSDWNFEYHCLLPDREKLYADIDLRVDQMIAAGWLEELNTLMTQGRGEPIGRARVIGYVELLAHLEGQYPLDEAIDLIKQNTRRYAKRQYTWFRNQIDGRFYGNRVEMLETLTAELSGRVGK